MQLILTREKFISIKKEITGVTKLLEDVCGIVMSFIHLYYQKGMIISLLDHHRSSCRCIGHITNIVGSQLFIHFLGWSHDYDEILTDFEITTRCADLPSLGKTQFNIESYERRYKIVACLLTHNVNVLEYDESIIACNGYVLDSLTFTSKLATNHPHQYPKVMSYLVDNAKHSLGRK